MYSYLKKWMERPLSLICRNRNKCTLCIQIATEQLHHIQTVTSIKMAKWSSKWGT